MKSLAVILALVVLWQAAYSFWNIPGIIIPAPAAIGQALADNFRNRDIYIHMLLSIERVAAGFAAAALAAVVLSLLLGYDPRIGGYLQGLFELLRPIPPIAWIPIAILLFGLGEISAYAIVFIGAFFPIFTNTYFGVVSLPKIYRDISKSFRIKRRKYVKDILFYHALPNIFTGLKIGIGMAWMSLIAAELIGAQSGLGYFIQINRLMLRTDNIMVGMLLIGAIGYALNAFIAFCEKKAMPWRKNI